jgi:hypothetical protein
MSPFILAACTAQTIHNALLLLFIGFLFYLGIHKLITYVLIKDASNAIKLLNFLNKLTYISCCLFDFCLIIDLFLTGMPGVGFIIGITSVIIFTIAWFIQKKNVQEIGRNGF